MLNKIKTRVILTLFESDATLIKLILAVASIAYVIFDSKSYLLSAALLIYSIGLIYKAFSIPYLKRISLAVYLLGAISWSYIAASDIYDSHIKHINNNEISTIIAFAAAASHWLLIRSGTSALNYKE